MSEPMESQEAGLFSWGVLIAIGVAATWLFLSALQAPPPSPIDTKLQSGLQVEFVFVGPTAPGSEGFSLAVAHARDRLRDQVFAAGRYFTTVGVSDHWSVEVGLQILDAAGPFDEVIVGRNWLNTGVQRYIDAMAGTPAVPQIVIFEFSVRTDTIPFRYSQRRELIRVVGHNAIMAWSNSGAVVNFESGQSL